MYYKILQVEKQYEAADVLRGIPKALGRRF